MLVIYRINKKYLLERFSESLENPSLLRFGLTAIITVTKRDSRAPGHKNIRNESGRHYTVIVLCSMKIANEKRRMCRSILCEQAKSLDFRCHTIRSVDIRLCFSRRRARKFGVCPGNPR